VYEYVCLPSAHFNTLPIPAGNTIWVSAQIQPLSSSVTAVAFENVTMLFRPETGDAGDQFTASGPSSYITFSPGSVACGTANYNPSTNAYNISSGAANQGWTLLNAASTIALADLGGYRVSM
jgi:hypothetical protein